MKNIFLRFKKRMSITLGLLLLESIAELLFPLVIGFAITDLLHHSYDGAIQLGILGIVAIALGGLRRMIDSRAYAYMYVQLGSELADNKSKLSASKKTAQLSLLKEVVEFLENSLPTLFTYVIGLVGTLLILVSLDVSIAVACISAALLTSGVYAATSRKTISLNKRWNDEFERRVDVVSRNDNSHTRKHLIHFMRWNIKLSDLETVNFSLTWIVAIALLLFSVIPRPKLLPTMERSLQ